MASASCPRQRQKGPSDDEWLRIKPDFERLYSCTSMTLNEISAILAQEHEFRAAPHMFKHRITQWGLRKNLKLEELEAVAAFSSPFVDAGLCAPRAMIGDREVPIHRVQRHFRNLLKPQNPKSASERTVAPGRPSPRDEDRKKIKARLRLQRLHTVPRVFLQHSAESHLLESTLVNVNNYCGGRSSPGDDYFIQQMLCANKHSAASGPDGLLHIAQPSLRKLLDQASRVLLQQPPAIKNSLSYQYVLGYGDNSERCRRVIYSYLDVTSRKTRGPDHPISMTLRLLQCRELSISARPSLLKLICEIASREVAFDPYRIFELELYLANASIHDDGFDTASQQFQKFLQRCEERFGKQSKHYRRALYLSGFLSYHHHFYDKAKLILQQVLESDDQYTPDARSVDRFSVNAMEILALMCENGKDHPDAEDWYSRAYGAACNSYGPNDSVARCLLYQLQQVQEKLGKRGTLSNEQRLGGYDILAELELQIAHMKLNDTAEVQGLDARSTPGNEWNDNRQEENHSADLTSNERHLKDSRRIDETEFEIEHETARPGLPGRPIPAVNTTSLNHQSAQAGFGLQFDTVFIGETGGPQPTETAIDGYPSMPLEGEDSMEASVPVFGAFHQSSIQLAQFDARPPFYESFATWPFELDLLDESWTLDPFTDQSEAELSTSQAFTSVEVESYLVTEHQNVPIPEIGHWDFEAFDSAEILDSLFGFECMEADLTSEPQTTDPRLVCGRCG